MKKIILNSASVVGLDVYPVTIEVSEQGQSEKKDFMLSIIGLDYFSASSCKKRISSALLNEGIPLPEKHYTINIAPAHMKKIGSLYDLPIIIGLLYEFKIISPETFQELNKYLIVGEISLFGDVKKIVGALPIALSLANNNEIKNKKLLVPYANLNECSLIEKKNIQAIKHIKNLYNTPTYFYPSEIDSPQKIQTELDFNQVHGQEQAKKALEIAAAGNHHVLLYGPPGAGKTMLAKRLFTILPEMSKQEKIEATTVYSSARLLPENEVIQNRPFRAPHHSITTRGFIGGGSIAPTPGEISLSHTGVLFLDELLEFSPRSLEMLRQVLEEKKVNIKRADYATVFPASFMLIGALNPCPCGFFGSQENSCTCSFGKIKQYISKLSGPLLDRLDMQVGLQPVKYDNIKLTENNESSAVIYERVKEASQIQMERNNGVYNGLLEGHQLEKLINIEKEAKEYLKEMFERMNISMRSYHKILKLSRTIADLNGRFAITIKDIRESLMYRSFDKLTQRFK